MALSKKLLESHFDFKLKMTKLCYQGSEIKNFQDSFFFLKSSYELIKETSRSLIFSCPARKCVWTLCDALDYFHTLHRLQRMIKKKKKKNFYNKILYSKVLEFTSHSKLKTGFLQKNKNPMPLMRLTTHLGKVNNNPNNYYIPIKAITIITIIL